MLFFCGAIEQERSAKIETIHIIADLFICLARLSV